MVQRNVALGVSPQTTESLPLPEISRALIVDDDPEVGMLLQTRLENRGFDRR